jgi:hypothetical protein
LTIGASTAKNAPPGAMRIMVKRIAVLTFFAGALAADRVAVAKSGPAPPIWRGRRLRTDSPAIGYLMR